MPNLQDSFWYHQSSTHVLAIWSWQASSKSFTITYKSVLDLTGVVHMDYCQLIMNTGIQWKVAARLISSMYNSEHHCWILYQGSVNSKYIATCVERCVRCIWSVVCQQNIITSMFVSANGKLYTAGSPGQILVHTPYHRGQLDQLNIVSI